MKFGQLIECNMSLNFCIIFEKNYFSCYILLIDQLIDQYILLIGRWESDFNITPFDIALCDVALFNVALFGVALLN